MSNGVRRNGMFVKTMNQDEVAFISHSLNNEKQDPTLIGNYEIIIRKGETMIFGEHEQPQLSIRNIDEPVRPKPAPKTSDKTEPTE